MFEIYLFSLIPITINTLYINILKAFIMKISGLPPIIGAVLGSLVTLAPIANATATTVFRELTPTHSESHLLDIVSTSSACWYKKGVNGAAVEFAEGVDTISNCIEQFEHVCEQGVTHVGVGTTAKPPTSWQKLTEEEQKACG